MAEMRVHAADIEPVKAALGRATELATAWARMPEGLREAIRFADPAFACHVARLTHSLLELKAARR